MSRRRRTLIPFPGQHSRAEQYRLLRGRVFGKSGCGQRRRQVLELIAQKKASLWPHLLLRNLGGPEYCAYCREDLAKKIWQLLTAWWLKEPVPSKLLASTAKYRVLTALSPVRGQFLCCRRQTGSDWAFLTSKMMQKDGFALDAPRPLLQQRNRYCAGGPRGRGEYPTGTRASAPGLTVWHAAKTKEKTKRRLSASVSLLQRHVVSATENPR